MKTLVIHPNDYTTKFLSVIYENINCTLILENPSTKFLKENIKSHDRIILLGHGDEFGLYGFDRRIINSDLVYLLKDKDLIGIWCNANKFFNKYNLKGFNTGMIISEFEEANLFCVNSSSSEIEKSNKLFAESIKITNNTSNIINVAREHYNGDSHVIKFILCKRNTKVIK